MTVSFNGKDPATPGTPLTTPVAPFRVRPDGSAVPTARDHVYWGFPPLAASCSRNGREASPEGAFGDEIFNAGTTVSA